MVAWIAKCTGKENEKITTAVDLNQDAKKRRKNTSDSTDSSKRKRAQMSCCINDGKSDFNIVLRHIVRSGIFY